MAQKLKIPLVGQKMIEGTPGLVTGFAGGVLLNDLGEISGIPLLNQPWFMIGAVPFDTMDAIETIGGSLLVLSPLVPQLGKFVPTNASTFGAGLAASVLYTKTPLPRPKDFLAPGP